MPSLIVDNFIHICRRQILSCNAPVECIEALIPEVIRLMSISEQWLEKSYLAPDSNHYARNVVYLDENNELGLYVLVWQPGQWTPVHDHGTWGVVGVLEGSLYEHNFIRCDQQPIEHDSEIELVRGGSLLLSPGAITSFVPNPDHIHITGNPNNKRVVSLHLYGHAMAGFNAYDIDKGTRKWFDAG